MTSHWLKAILRIGHFTEKGSRLSTSSRRSSLVPFRCQSPEGMNSTAAGRIPGAGPGCRARTFPSAVPSRGRALERAHAGLSSREDALDREPTACCSEIRLGEGGRRLVASLQRLVFPRTRAMISEKCPGSACNGPSPPDGGPPHGDYSRFSPYDEPLPADGGPDIPETFRRPARTARHIPTAARRAATTTWISTQRPDLSRRRAVVGGQRPGVRGNTPSSRGSGAISGGGGPSPAYPGTAQGDVGPLSRNFGCRRLATGRGPDTT